MPRPKEYEERAESIIGQITREIGSDFGWSTTTEAKSIKKAILQAKRELQEIKKELSEDIKIIKSQYTAIRKKDREKGFSYGVTAGLFGGKAASVAHASHMKKLRGQQNQELYPYENVKNKIESFMSFLDDKKDRVDQYLNPSKNNAPEQSPTSFSCTNIDSKHYNGTSSNKNRFDYDGNSSTDKSSSNLGCGLLLFFGIIIISMMSRCH